MHQEYLSIVDENDRVIGKALRSIIHRDRLLHRAVHILVFNDSNLLFLQKRSLTKDINPGLWDSSAAGHVDVGEDYDECAVRELHEELGVQVDRLSPLFKLSATPVTGMEFIEVYRCDHNGPFSLATEEIEEGRWFDTKEIDARVNDDDPTLTETFKSLWQRYEILNEN
ncbi:NUDIX hydrolase [Methylotuvimicrobium sp.]|uniref:NUDIX hydrolase n=1 Tax=Methylotuvimicrobium sp. TaxID=2822413 RepID=UPI003D646CEB